MPLARLFLALFFLQSPKPGTVSGTVTNQATGGGVRKAHITLRSGDNTYDATTDAEGHFSIAVPPGGFYARADCQGYEALQRPEPVRVNEDQHVDNISFSLMPHGVIAGRVVDENGEPLVRMTVQAQVETFGRGGRKLNTAGMMQTDDRGAYRIFDLPAGRYLLLVTNPSVAGSPAGRLHVAGGPETAYVGAWFPGVSDVSQATASVLAPGAELGGIDIRMRRVRVYHIRGRVVIQGGTRADGPVQLSQCDTPVGAGSFAPVLHDGSFDAIDIVPGVWCATVTQMSGDHGWYGQQKVSVTDRDVNNVAITAAPSAEIRGQVMVNGETSAKMQQGNVTVESVGPVGRGIGAGTLADGTFTLHNVPPGIYQVRIGLSGYLKGVRFNGQDSADGRITVTSGGQLTVMVATDVGDISGTVQGPANIVTASLAGTDVVAMAGVGPGGNFRMGNLAPGDYRVIAWESRDYGLTQYDEFRKQFDGRAVTVTVHASGHETASVTTVTAAEIETAKGRLQ